MAAGYLLGFAITRLEPAAIARAVAWSMLVIVMSHDGFNLTPAWRSVIIVPVSTSPSQAARGPTAVALPAGAGGLGKASVALCHQVTTLDRAKLATPLGRLTPEQLRAVEEGLKAALDLP